MTFPQTERVVFARNPLVEVICQIRFPRLMEIESDLPVKLQQRMRAAFPKSETRIVTELFPSEAASRRTIYDFSTGDGSATATLTSDFLALTSRAYVSWDSFYSSLASFVDAAKDIYPIKQFTRVGLRYRNVIDREALNLGEVPWSDLVRRELLGLLAGADFPVGDLVEAANVHLITLSSGASVRLNAALLRSENSDSTAYLIDADFFLEEDIDALTNATTEILGDFNVEAGNLFRWAVTDLVHGALRSR